MSESEQAVEGPVDVFALVGTVLERKFRIEKIVAEGGFGVVYYGTHLTLEKPVAVKVLKTPGEFNDKARAQFIEKFALEGKTMARISHPNIVQVLDFGASEMPNGEMAPWMVLEWLSGQTLEAVLQGRRGKGPFTPGETYATLKPVLEALAYAHDEGIAHRDIKPANMMLVQSKRGSTLRLMDFGIAKLMDDGEQAGTGATRTRTSMNAFSPQYAAPEQLSGTRSGPWTDVHAMALIITEMLTDKMPYDGQDMTTLFSQILNPVRPTPVNRGAAPSAWDDVLTRALALRPDERFKDAGEFLAALDAALPSHAQSSNTGAFQALTVNGTVPTAPTSNSMTSSPTTLRGAEVSAVTAVPPPVAPKSKLPMMIVAGVLLVVGGAGAAIAFTSGNRGSAQPPRVTAASANAASVPTPPPAHIDPPTPPPTTNIAAPTVADAAAAQPATPTAPTGDTTATNTQPAVATPDTHANANGAAHANSHANAGNAGSASSHPFGTGHSHAGRSHGTHIEIE